LLDQRRSGARHADDKDRIFRRAAAGPFGKRFGGELGDAPVDLLANFRGVIGMAREPERIGP